MKSCSVCVLMSTYNGEKYVCEQIESILQQKGVNVHLIVRDDGSTDGTLDVLKEYEKKKELRIIATDSNKNLGAACSFMELLYSVGEYDYYAFADQDDIWHEKKLLSAVNKMDNVKTPILYASNQYIFENDAVKGKRFEKVPNCSLVGVLYRNYLSGCTMVFNKSLKDILVKESYRPSEEMLKLRMHDTWVAAVAALCGSIVYDENAYIDYRIHDNNTVGLINDSRTNLGDMIQRIRKKKSVLYRRSLLASELIGIAEEYTSNNDNIEIVEAFAGRKAFKLIVNNSIKRDCPEKRALFITKALCRCI